MLELYIFSLNLSALNFLFPSSPHPPLRSGPLIPARRSVDSDVARSLKGGTRKTGLNGDLSRASYARVWRGIRGLSLPREKIEFGIGGGAISFRLY